MSYADKLKYRAGEYSQLNTLPASVSVAFLLVTLYQFGAMDPISLNWVDFTLATEFVLPVSVGAILIAGLSSETKDWRHYELPEQVLIIGMLVAVLGWQLTPPEFWASNLPVLGEAVRDALTGIGSPLAGQLATLLAVLGWGALIN